MSNKLAGLLLTATTMLAACVAPMSGAGDDSPGHPGQPGGPSTPTPRPKFKRCTDRAYTPAADEGWRHDIVTPIVTAAGAPNHAGKDIIAKQGSAVALTAKLTYGFVSKDLEDEDVLVSIDDCTQWRSLGRTKTNSDGRVSVAAPAGLTVGVYEVRFQVAGDQSLTTSFLWVFPAATRFIVSDIDATLTTADRAVFEQIFTGLVPAAYPSGPELMAAHAERGHVVIYLTGRPYWLSEMSRDWLVTKQFTPGPLRVTDSNAGILPLDSSVGDYKLAQLDALLAAGFVIDAAYGNATTDIYAYLNAGIDAERVWIIGDHAGEEGTHAVTGSWSERATAVAASAKVAQPFDW